jgi:threonine/homoserine/homoserine lactone efflux protein
MPDVHLFAAFVATVTLLMLLPGPNVGLIVGNTVGHGTGHGLLTVAGTTTAIAVQLALTALGLVSLLGHAGLWFSWIRWIGVAYLIYLGIKSWRAAPCAQQGASLPPASPRGVLAKAFLVSLTNPKTLFFYGALLPQFISPAGHFADQMTLLAITCVTIALIVDTGWCLLAGRLRGHLGGRLANRIGGSVLIGAALGLALARGAKF